MSITCNLLSNNLNIISQSSLEQPVLNNHALIGISTFNSYFSVENMEKLFLWASQNFKSYNAFFMDEDSVYNLMAIGYDKQKSLQKTRKHDRNLYNKIVKSLVNIGLDLNQVEEKIILLSMLKKNQNYCELYEKFVSFFERSKLFRNDCLGATHAMLAEKIQHISEESLFLAVKYLLAELPLWFDTPHILNVESSTIIYKDLSMFWKRICYDYDLLSENQSVFIKNVATEDSNS